MGRCGFSDANARASVTPWGLWTAAESRRMPWRLAPGRTGKRRRPGRGEHLPWRKTTYSKSRQEIPPGSSSAGPRAAGKRRYAPPFSGPSLRAANPACMFRGGSLREGAKAVGNDRDDFREETEPLKIRRCSIWMTSGRGKFDRRTCTWHSS